MNSYTKSVYVNDKIFAFLNNIYQNKPIENVIIKYNSQFQMAYFILFI